MNFAEQLQILQAAQGDPAKLALATVDLAYPALADGERAQIKETLEAAAIPHWCDESILAALLEITPAESAARLARLRGLSVIEAFAARGDNAVNVHETARLALRERMVKERAEQFRRWSARATACFGQQTGPHAQIEAVFHRVFSEPDAYGDAIESLYQSWNRAGRFEELRALGGMLAELRTSFGIQSLPRAVACEKLGWIRRSHQPVERTAALAREALEVYRSLKDDLRAGLALDLLGQALLSAGKVEQARKAFAEELETFRRLAAQQPDDRTCLRNVSVSLEKLGDLDLDEGRQKDARRAFAEDLEIARRLTALDPANTEWQRDVFVSHTKMASVTEDAAEKKRWLVEALPIIERLATLDPENVQWQNDLKWLRAKLTELK